MCLLTMDLIWIHKGDRTMIRELILPEREREREYFKIFFEMLSFEQSGFVGYVVNLCAVYPHCTVHGRFTG